MAQVYHRPVWLAVPRNANSAGTLLDGVPIPLGSPGQFLKVHAQWIEKAQEASVSATAPLEGEAP